MYIFEFFEKLEVIYFTALEKDFFSLKPDNLVAYFRRWKISEMRHVHMFAITIS